MALETTSYKQIGLILGIALTGVILVVGTVTYRNRDRKVETPTEAFVEPESGLVFDAPGEWTVGTEATNTLQVRGVRLSAIQTQRSSCSNFSQAESKTLRSHLEAGQDAALASWRKQYPGLVAPSIVTGSGGVPVLVGIDTCSVSLNRRMLALRAQAYRNNVEVRFTVELDPDQSTSQSALDETAATIAAGTNSQFSSEYARLVQVIQSAR